MKAKYFPYLRVLQRLLLSRSSVDLLQPFMHRYPSKLWLPYTGHSHLFKTGCKKIFKIRTTSTNRQLIRLQYAHSCRSLPALRISLDVSKQVIKEMNNIGAKGVKPPFQTSEKMWITIKILMLLNSWSSRNDLKQPFKKIHLLS